MSISAFNLMLHLTQEWFMIDSTFDSLLPNYLTIHLKTILRMLAFNLTMQQFTQEWFYKCLRI